MSPSGLKKLKPLHYVLIGVITLFIILWWNFLPHPLFSVPSSTVLLDRNDKIIGMTVADDGQFRVSGRGNLSPKYVSALIAYEDKRFLTHKGVDIWAMLRALRLNLKNNSIISGGSTLSMQVIRLSKSNPPRTITEKLKEMLLAIRLEQSYSKWDIINFYADHAPFGGNIVGIKAASLKYFDREPDQLSWAEAALMAVLPNAPSLMFPGKNMPGLKNKRDKLLYKMHEIGYFNADDLNLYMAEPLPDKIYNVQSITPHLLAKAFLQRRGEISKSYIDPILQKQVNGIIRRHTDILKHNHIYNAAVIVAHVPTGEVRSYVGNAPYDENGDGYHVDIINSRRSSGSVFKPALYALMQESGQILPTTLLSDIPSRFGRYSPSNFNKDFKGVIPADKALSTSLNIPFVRMLRDYGVEHFYDDIKQMGITTLNNPADHYGLSLILGGAECSLWDLANMYGGMTSTLLHYNENDGNYYNHEYRRLKLWTDEKIDSTVITNPVLNAGSIWLTLKALLDVERPDLESGWKNFASSMDLCWKTGTSFGFRDAWAVGVNAEYVIAVWVGNANGEGRPGLIGVRAAAPILFEVSSLLRTESKIYIPTDVLKETVICRRSGYRASENCPETDTIMTCKNAIRSSLCPYHKMINLDATGKYQVNSDCEPVYNIQRVPWFILSPAQEWYYSRAYADYKKLPGYRADCQKDRNDMMEMIYPQHGIRVFIPKDLDGEKKGVIFEMVHRSSGQTVFWHIDDKYMGATRYHHQLEVDIEPGRHTIYLVDEDGNTLRQFFYVVSGDENYVQ